MTEGSGKEILSLLRGNKSEVKAFLNYKELSKS